MFFNYDQWPVYANYIIRWLIWMSFDLMDRKSWHIIYIKNQDEILWTIKLKTLWGTIRHVRVMFNHIYENLLWSTLTQSMIEHLITYMRIFFEIISHNQWPSIWSYFQKSSLKQYDTTNRPTTHTVHKCF